MEHIVQFAISIDDETIQKKLEEYAYDDILKQIKDEWKKELPKKCTWNRYKDEGKIDWDLLTKDVLYKFCDEHKDTIIEMAAKNLCESFKRTKAFKEKMTESMEELCKQ